MDNLNDHPSTQTQPTVEQLSPVPPKTPISSKTFLVFIGVLIFVSFAAFTAYQLIRLGGIYRALRTTTYVSVQPSPTPDPTANWKTYRNEKFGFEVRYPKEWEEILQKPELPLQKFGALFASPDKIGTFSSKATIWIRPLEAVLGEEGMTKEGRDKYFQGLRQLPGKKSTVFFGKYPAIEILPSLSRQDFAKLKGHNISVDIVVYEPNTAFNAELDIKNYTEGAELIYLPVFHQILSTFKFTDQSPSATCIPRPACLDAVPRCLIPESENMCPPKPTSNQVVCTQDAKQCPDGSYVSRQPPTCEFAKCP